MPSSTNNNPSKKESTSDDATPPAAVHKPSELNNNIPPFTKDDDEKKGDDTAAKVEEAPQPPLVTTTDVTDEKMASPSPKKKLKKAVVKEYIVDHTYRDFSQVEVEPEDDKVGNPSVDLHQSKRQQNFPAKLHEIVSNPSYQHIIRWQPHGRSWKIVDKHLLSTLICPKHYAHAKFESFNRSVNGWGFKRLLSPGPDHKTYYHECFLRGRPHLVGLMTRLVNPGKRLPDKDGEPDFYKISREHPLPEGPVPPSTPGGTMAGHANMHQHQPQLGYPPQASPHAYAHSPYGHSPYYPAPYGQPDPQQMYWPGQVSSPSYQGNPYGYYPPSYPPMMMVPQQPQSGAAQQAMYYMAPGPYGQQHPQPQFMPQRMQQLPGTAVAMPEGAKPGDDIPMKTVENTTKETKEGVKPDANNGEGVESGKKAEESVESAKEVKEAAPPSTKDLKPVTPSTKEEGEEKKERSEEEENKKD